MPVLPPFPEIIDSTIRSTMVACHRQFYYAYLLNLRKSTTNIHLAFGSAVARGLEVVRIAYWQNRLDEVSAIAEGCKAIIQAWGDFELTDEIRASRGGVKTLDAALDALYSYFEEYPLASDNVTPLLINDEPIVEKTFALPIPGTRHPVTGNPIIYAGRIDMVGRHRDAIFVIDEKTSTSLGSSWRSNWPLRGQLTGYVWGCRSFGIDAVGCIVRGIGILRGFIQFEQVVMSHPPWMVDQWLTQLTRDVRRAVEAWRAAGDLSCPELAFDQAFDQACSSYGGCAYTSLCESQNPSVWYDEFVRQPWNPLAEKQQ